VGGFALVVALLAVISMGTGVMVFKQTVDDDRQRLLELRHELVEARAATARLQAELAYHRRPAYLARFAPALGLAPAQPHQIVDIEHLPARPMPVAEGEPAPRLVALPSGERVGLAPRPAQGSRP